MIIARHNNLSEGGFSYWFWCPGCKIAHRYAVGAGDGPRWDFNENLDSPSFSPSLLTVGEKRCHLFLKDGKLEFCKDCDHELVGKIVNLPELPDWLAGAGRRE